MTYHISKNLQDGAFTEIAFEKTSEYGLRSVVSSTPCFFFVSGWRPAAYKPMIHHLDNYTKMTAVDRGYYPNECMRRGICLEVDDQFRCFCDDKLDNCEGSPVKLLFDLAYWIPVKILLCY
ncbi:unnamed protein product [Cylicocyclus nassatus]|uniref:Uncharacterized protein n=1 Tax=Cylicocyclus nassatus TaxID=53992 RepID=A0AA36GSY1_CYLNA|nr:unnamed protein product [Cylicocyclus nassatus]